MPWPPVYHRRHHSPLAVAPEKKSYIDVDTLMPQVPPQPPAAVPAEKKNVPLAQSENERARGLVTLDRKFTSDIAAMPPRAAAYFRRRSFLSPEVLGAWRAGYLPRDVGEDKSGGT